MVVELGNREGRAGGGRGGWKEGGCILRGER